MPHDDGPRELGKRVAYFRRIARMTQRELADAACLHIGTVQKIERGARGAGDGVRDALAAALGIDPSRLESGQDRSDARVHEAMPGLSAVLAAYDVPADGPTRSLPELRSVVGDAVTWRLSAHYAQIARHLPLLVDELTRAFHAASADDRREAAHLLAAAYRTADAVAYKFRARDLSARLIELMRWVAPYAENPLLDAATAYVRTETFFTAQAHAAGLRALERAIDASPNPVGPHATAARGALHMRAAVIAGRAADPVAAHEHLAQARALAELVPEGVYTGTAFGPDSVRIHRVAVAVSLGNDHTHRALDEVNGWRPPHHLPAERRSGFHIELARAQLWSGDPHAAFASLRAARRIAPQHAREHRWVREDVATLRRLRRSDAGTLTEFARWCHAYE
ncbi:helix-turn-helix domain-containing protein [Streptomyces sp. NPDC018031]|uniref:helix-turn-helix domain-containing protein n=1 Tax=Streptomyces sp. NPDC018031 TaxID=3365033 RepID=UPI0037B7C0E9